MLYPTGLTDSLYLSTSTCVLGSQIKTDSATDAAEGHVPSGVGEKASQWQNTNHSPVHLWLKGIATTTEEERNFRCVSTCNKIEEKLHYNGSIAREKVQLREEKVHVD